MSIDTQYDHPPFLPKSKTSGHNAKSKSDPDELRQKFLNYIEQGLTVAAACAKIDRTPETYKWWRRSVDGFAEEVDRIRQKMAGTWTRPETGDFASFRAKYLHMETFTHQQQWIDVLEGEEPRDLDPACTYYPGRPQRLLINTPPFHAKSTTITQDYVVYRICQDLNFACIVISESKNMAQKMLRAIKHRLTHPDYAEMHQAFGPAGGFKVGSASWTESAIYVGGRDTPDKDPTVEVLGVGSQIQGARAKLIICDDVATQKTGRTLAQTEKLTNFIDQDVTSRLHPQEGKLVIVGTRVGPNDVYAAYLKRDKSKTNPVWTYLGQPAVFEYADEPADWKTCWPFMFDGISLDLIKEEYTPQMWNLVYQQQSVSEDMTFPQDAVEACRYVGSVGELREDIRKAGMNGLYVIAGLDPAGSGYTSIVVYGVDRLTKRRYVLDVTNQRAMTPAQLETRVEQLCSRYQPNEWRIEKNGIQTHISQNPHIRRIIQASHGRIVEHQTGNNKWDHEFGIMSMAPLFLAALHTPPENLIFIPDNGRHRGILALLDQLITWEPDTKARTDCLMALWFAELGARKMLEIGGSNTHVKNKWLSQRQIENRRVVSISELIAEKQLAGH